MTDRGKRHIAIIGMGLLTLSVVVLYAIVFQLSTEANRRFIRAAPAGVRTTYLNAIFDNPDEFCMGCRTRLVAALEALMENTLEQDNSWGYDHARILRFIPGDNEPIAPLACHIVILGGNPAVLRKMAAQYGQRPEELDDCIHSGLWLAREVRSPRLAHIRAALNAIPSLTLIAAHAENRRPNQPVIGYATIDNANAITLKLRPHSMRGILHYPTSDPRYRVIRNHIGPIAPGQIAPVFGFRSGKQLGQDPA